MYTYIHIYIYIYIYISAATRVRGLSLRGCVESKRGTSEGERADRVAEG